MNDSALFQAFVYLLAAVIMVPVSRRLGLGSVLGYLLAGVLIGPSVLKLVGSGSQVMKFAEFGVVMMLFLIGLELRPSLLWRLRVPIVGMGGMQVFGVGGAIAIITLTFGLSWQAAVAIGLILAMSSTAIVLQSLSERGQLKHTAGQSCFSVLLFQDIAVIPILAIMPLLGSGAPAGENGHGHSLIGDLPAWQRGLATIGAVLLIVIAGRLLMRHVFRFVAQSRLREIFTELTLVLVIGVTLLMEMVGLSAALGAFVSGLMLADSEYRHQLEADIEPFKGVLLGVFFTSVGAGIDFARIGSQPGWIASLVAGLVALKFVIHLVIARIFRHTWSQGTLFGLALAQGGEFCFVLLSFALSAGVFGAEVQQTLVAVVAISMAVTPLLFVLNDRVLQPWFFREQAKPEREPDEIPEHENPVLLAGFGRFGHIVGRLLRANGVGCTILENDSEQIDLLAQFGLKAYYGDATRPELLHAAGASKAKLFISTLADTEKSVDLVKLVQREFPHLKILARAVSRQHAYELLKAGVDDVFRETLGSAIDLGVKAMRNLGFRGVQATRAARIFKEHDEAGLRDLVQYLDDDTRYVSRARQHIENLERVLQADRESLSGSSPDEAWEIGLPRNQE